MYYLVNRETKEHIRIPEDRLWMLVENRRYHDLAKADADGWIEWKGGDCPLPDGSEYCVRCRSGAEVCQTDPQNGYWDTNHGESTVIAYRPIINTKEKEMNQEWKPEAGAKAQTSGGECEILAVDNERGMVSVRWNDGELGTVRIACVKPLPTDRERWIEVALNSIAPVFETGNYQSRIIGMVYDAGLAKLPEQTK